MYGSSAGPLAAGRRIIPEGWLQPVTDKSQPMLIPSCAALPTGHEDPGPRHRYRDLDAPFTIPVTVQMSPRDARYRDNCPNRVSRRAIGPFESHESGLSVKFLRDSSTAASCQPFDNERISLDFALLRESFNSFATRKLWKSRQRVFRLTREARKEGIRRNV